MDTEVLDEPQKQSLADLLHDLGDIPPERVRRRPPPGTATVDDLLKPENKCCELVDGTLVEKAMGFHESNLAAVLLALFDPHVRKNNLGILTGADGAYELLSGLVREPDVAFISWDRLPGRKRPVEPIPDVIPDLAIEVLSLSNTKAEMARKRSDYFKAGVVEVWEINPRSRTARVYTAAETWTEQDSAGSISSPVVPGFTLSLAELFAELDRQG